jgi:hypothetical protein
MLLRVEAIERLRARALATGESEQQDDQEKAETHILKRELIRVLQDQSNHLQRQFATRFTRDVGKHLNRSHELPPIRHTKDRVSLVMKQHKLAHAPHISRDA